ncbi:SCO7613 C-terminal domain-containing membrane protein [Nocardioides bigeumensis]|uniref:DUF2157 domain-containing protein n=1 Tax=Nocardioides bigeumensis TaxID=433657 RepID=A0ABP5K3L1_9ACTN
MAVYADPTRCPDCRTTLPPSPPTCPTCALPLTGPVVEDLFATLQKADRLLADVRASASPAPMAATPGAVPAPHPVIASLEPRRRGLSAPSVPVILLGLGAVCLLVAAVTFLAFAWAWLGVGGRTAVLVLLTAGTGVASELLRRRRLRVAAESLSLVALGLLVLDVLGAENAGWLGDPGAAGVLVALGVAVAVPSLTWTLATRGSAPLSTPQLASAVALSLVVAGWMLRTEEPYAGAAIGAALLLAVTAAARRLGLAPLVVAATASATLWWLPLTLSAFVRAADHATLAELVGQVEAWPLVVSAATLAAGSWLVRDSTAVAGAGFGGAATLATLLPVIAAADNNGADLALVLVAATLVWSVALVRLRSGHRLAAAVPLSAVTAGTGLLATALVAEAATAAADLFADPWTHPWAVRLGPVESIEPTGAPAAMLAPLVVAAAVAVLAGRLAFRGRSPAVPNLLVRAAAGGMLVVAAVAAASEVPLAVVLALAVAAGVGLVAWGVRRGDRTSVPDVAVGAATLATALLCALASAGLTAVVAGLLLLVAVGVVLRPARDDVAMLAVLVAPPLFALAGWAGTELAPVPDAWRAAPLVLALGLVITRFPMPELEITAIAAGATVAALSVVSAVHPEDALAAYLTLGGALLVASSIVNVERRFLAWAGGALLAAATWVRLWDAGVTTPEAYTMPTALALLAVGATRLARDRAADTWSTISAGLLLATVPSLVTVVTAATGGPVSLRSLLLGLGCLALALAGAAMRWSAPLLVGAGVGLVLVLREWGPYAAAVPPWVVIGVAGSLLLVVGVTWEARLQELRRGAAYLARLR